jgi:polysaccharide chain length determinant protein (PEP-CTERM system associated)
MSEIYASLLGFLKAIGKYRWYAVAIAWVLALAGWAWVYSLPNQYQASARVYVDTQSILRPLLSGMTSVPDLEQQVTFMRKTLISKPNVEKVLRMVDLDVKSKSVAEHEELVDELMSQIKIQGTERDDIYTISYTNPNPKLGKDIVQALLTLFLEGSYGGKKQDSEKAVQFIDDQIKSYEGKLSTAENALKDFKVKHYNLLPRNGADYGGKMAELNDQLSSARLELAEAEQARNALRRQLPAADGADAPGADIGLGHPELDQRIAAVEKNLDALRMQFTEEHPDIVGGKRLLEQLRAKRADELKNRKPSADPGASYSPMLQQMSVSLSAAEARVAGLRARVIEYGSRLAQLRQQMTAAPEVEAQLAQLNRDYQVNKENYEKLVASREAAKLSGSLTSATDMLSFRVIDPPTVPALPAGPHRLQLYTLAFLVALAGGLGAALALSQLRPTFLSQRTLREVTGLPVLGSVGMNWTDRQRVHRQRRMVALSMAFAVLVCTYGGIVAFTFLRAQA